MPERFIRWIKQPTSLLTLVLAILIIGWVVFFIIQVIQNIFLIRSGQPTSLEQLKLKRFEASVSQQFAHRSTQSDNLQKIEQGKNPTRGNPQGSVRIVEFVDYDCPFCKQVAPVVREMLRRHPEVTLIIRDFPVAELHPDAPGAALAANCVFSLAGNEAYWSYADRLFSTQGEHRASQLRLYALQMGIEAHAFDRCIASLQSEQAVKRSLEDGINAGVEGTPTFFFNGLKIQGALDLESFDVAIKAVQQSVAKP